MGSNGLTGKFIIIEGLDGSGTTTQLKLLQEWFKAEEEKSGKARPLYFTWEPTPGPVGSLIRLALHHRLQPFDEKTMALLYAADRTDHIYKVEKGGQEPGVLSKLRSGTHVICDRYVLSSLAYQARELGLDWTFRVNDLAVSPDVTIYIDVDPVNAARRMAAARSHQDMYESLPEQQKIRAQYFRAIEFLREKGQRVEIVNGEGSPAQVRDAVLGVILPLLEG